LRANFYNTLKNLAVAVSLLKARYNGSLVAALSSLYPGHKFLPWRFVGAPKNFWADARNQREYFDWLGRQLGVGDYQDWYSTTLSQIKVLDGTLQ
jgi:hypothetical protein